MAQSRPPKRSRRGASAPQAVVATESQQDWRVRTQGRDSFFDVVVVPRASRSRIVGLHGHALKVTLAAPPVDGEANAELCAVLAKALCVPKRAISIVAGEHAKTKTIRAEGVSRDAVIKLPAEVTS